MRYMRYRLNGFDRTFSSTVMDMQTKKLNNPQASVMNTQLYQYFTRTSSSGAATMCSNRVLFPSNSSCRRKGIALSRDSENTSRSSILNMRLVPINKESRDGSKRKDENEYCWYENCFCVVLAGKFDCHENSCFSIK